MKSQCYFTHSSSEHHSAKLLPMINEYGMKGYGWYWVVMETLRDEDDYTLPLNDFTVMALQAKFRTLAEDIPDRGTIQGFVKFCIQAGIFFLDSDRFGSSNLSKQMEHMEKIITTRSEAGRKGGFAKANQLPSNCQANAKQKIANAKLLDKIREDDIREDYIREDLKEQKNVSTPQKSTIKPSKTNYAEYVSMTNEEHQKLVTEHGEQATAWMINKLDNYKGSTGKKYKDDYRAILSWVIKSWREETNNGKTIKRDIDYITDPAGSGEPDYSFADLERIDREHWATENAKKRS